MCGKFFSMFRLVTLSAIAGSMKVEDRAHIAQRERPVIENGSVWGRFASSFES
jgi:hypothetical protein